MTAATGLWGCVLLALWLLPPEHFPLASILAFTLPALLLERMLRLGVTRWPALSFAAAVQVGAVFLLATWLGKLSPQAGLGCTLLPPLVFLSARLQPTDAIRALFLAFCVFLIAVILGDPTGLQCLLFLSLAAATMLFDARDVLRNEAGEPLDAEAATTAPTPARIGSRVAVIATVLAVCLGCFQLLQLIPSPGRDGDRDEDEPTRSDPIASAGEIGVSKKFELDGDSPGGVLNLRHEELLTVRSVSGRPLPEDLYLRGVYFDLAYLEAWNTSSGHDEQPIPQRWREPHPLERTHAIEVTFTASPGDDLVFVPPGAMSLQPVSIPPVFGDPSLGWIRMRRPPNVGARYRTTYQDLRLLAEQLPVETRWNVPRVDTKFRRYALDFRALLEEAGVRRNGDGTAIEKAERITRLLHRRCRYELRRPTGPYDHALLNFLWGDRHGFCMHFASATALLLHYAGVPCRVGAGVMGGDATDDPTVRVFGQQDAHAWVEIPLRQGGWVVFEPTPSAGAGPTQRHWLSAQMDPVESEDPAADDDPEDDLLGLDRTIALFAAPGRHAWIWGVVIALLVTTVVLTRPRSERDRDATTAPPPPESLTARRLLRDLLGALARAGRPRLVGQTLEQYATRFTDLEDDRRTAIERALAAYQEVRFGGRPFDTARRARLQSAVDRARDWARERKRARDERSSSRDA